MKLAFSTLGCPGWTFDQILNAAVKYKYDGIEFRGLLDKVDLPETPEFSPGGVAETRRRLDDAGVRAACLSSSVSIVHAMGAEVDRHTAIAHTRLYLDLAKEVGAPCVRLFCGNYPATMEPGVALDLAADTLRLLGDDAHDRGVKIAIETHDAFIRTDQLMELIRLANHPAVGVLWDIHHPYRIMGETVEQSMRHLDGRVMHAHVKDSVMSEGGEGYTYVLLGRGDVPVPEAMATLAAAGYDGYFSLEWEKRWVPSLEEPEVAIPQYAEQMRAWAAE
ncbi:MAG: fructoselysine 3-epimerase [bacterium ADurb.Bin429]|nr:MAG: fructoselysine 3-epimerase [bacterium ADurb.Bin429]